MSSPESARYLGGEPTLGSRFLFEVDGVEIGLFASVRGLQVTSRDREHRRGWAERLHLPAARPAGVAEHHLLPGADRCGCAVRLDEQDLRRGIRRRRQQDHPVHRRDHRGVGTTAAGCARGRSRASFRCAGPDRISPPARTTRSPRSSRSRTTGFVVRRRTGETGGGERYFCVRQLRGPPLGGARPAISPAPRTVGQCRRRSRPVLRRARSGSAGPPTIGRADADQGRRCRRCGRPCRAAAVVGAGRGADGIVLGFGQRRYVQYSHCRCRHRATAAARCRSGADAAEPSPRSRDGGHGRQDHSGPPGSRGDLRREYERGCH